MEIDALLSPVSPDGPCGPNLEYDHDFLALERAASGKPEQQFGDSVVQAEEPDWLTVKQLAASLLGRTKDLRVAVLLTRALTRTENLVGVCQGLKLIRELLTQYWDGLHPELDADDDNDPTMRLNALAPLADFEAFLADIKKAYLVEPGRFGKVSVRDVLVLAGKLSAAGEDNLSQAEFEGVLRSSHNGDVTNPQVAAIHEALTIFRELERLLADKVGVERVPNLKPVHEILQCLVKACDDIVVSDVGATDGMGDTAMDDGSQGEKVASVAVAGQLRSRDDVIKTLDRVCEFIERTEPTNPAPLLIRRAQRLMTMSFVEIIQELAPDGVGQMRNIAGLASE